MLQNNDSNKAIDLVYKSAGFQKESIFAATFKSVERISYFEYIKTLKKDGTNF